MKYLYNTNVEYISQCDKDRFFVRVYDEEKTQNKAKTDSWRKNDKYYSEYLMDKLGRIFDCNKVDYFNTNSRGDDLFEGSVNLKNLLLDKNANVVFKDYDDISFFDKLGRAVKRNDDKSEVVVDRKGKVLCNKFKRYMELCETGGIAQLENNNYVLFDENFEVCSKEYKYIAPFSGNEFSFIETDDGVFSVNRKLEVLGGPFENVYYIDNNIIYAANNEPGKILKYFDIYGNEIFPQANLIRISQDGIARICRVDGLVEFFDLVNNRRIGDVYKTASEELTNYGANVVVGEDKDGFLWTILKKDGTCFKNNYGAIVQLSDKYAALYVDNPSGKSGNYYIFDENENLALKKPIKAIRGSKDGFAICEMRSKNARGTLFDYYKYLNTETLDFLPENFELANLFNCKRAVVKTSDKYDAITQTGFHLSEVSKFAEKIDKNPAAILNMPQEFFADSDLVDELYKLAVENLKQKHDGANSDEEKNKIINLKLKIDDFYKKIISETADLSLTSKKIE